MTQSPLYVGIADDLRNKIRNGEAGHQVGDQLPRMELMARRLYVSRTTVRNAIDTLAYDGYVEVTVGRGTFVLPQRFWRS